MRRSQTISDASSPDDNRKKREDIGTLAARAALQNALGQRLKDYDDGPQVILLSVPSNHWVQPIIDAWRIFAKAGRVRVRHSCIGENPDTKDWVCVSQEARGQVNLEHVELGLACGIQVLIIAHLPAALTPGVTAMADASFQVEPLRWEDVKKVAVTALGRSFGEAKSSCAGGDMPDKPDANVVRALNPVLLRLAVRRGESAGPTLARALRLARVESVVKTAESNGPHGFARVPGLGKALDWGRSLARDIKAYRAGQLGWDDIDRGVLLSGPPGCGKTTFAGALAEECGVPLVIGSHASWQAAGHQGEMLKAMRTSFAEAKGAAPCLLFIDEIDSFPDRDTVGQDHQSYVRQVVNGLLAEMDGAVAREGVVVIGACNNPELLDPALKRAGRLDRHIQISLPDAQGMANILRVHLGQDLMGEDIAVAARLAVGHSGAEAEKWCREARRIARQQGRSMALGDLLMAISEGCGMSLEPVVVFH